MAGLVEPGSLALKVSGALSGCILVPSMASTVGQLRQEAARLLGVQDPTQVKIICSGRNLQGDAQSLQQCGVTERSRLLVTRGAAAGAQLNETQQQAQRLQQLKEAAEKLAARDGRGLTDKYELVLENQDGSALQLADADRRALVMGLSLHSKGAGSMRRGRFGEALQELLLAEEAFGLADARLMQGIDNAPLLLLDIVWCCYKLQDAGRLATCQERLRRARQGLQAAHGASLERLRRLHGGVAPELAMYVRLETLEGLVAYHMQELGRARETLQAAQARWQKLQVPDEALAALAAMGYSSLKRAKRALRFCGGSVAAAAEFLAQEDERQGARKEARRKLGAWNHERLRYGKTSSGRYVDGALLDQLAGLGYQRELAAEALRLADNELQAALDCLTDPQRSSMLLLTLVAQSMEAERQYGPQQVDPQLVERLQRLGFREYYARHALHRCGGDYDRALRALHDWGEDRTRERAGHEQGQQQGQPQDTGPAAAGGTPLPEAPPPQDTSAAAAAAEASEAGAGGSRAGGGEAGSDSNDEQHALEHEIVGQLQEDPLAAYDLDVAEEGQLIRTLLASIEAQQG